MDSLHHQIFRNIDNYRLKAQDLKTEMYLCEAVLTKSNGCERALHAYNDACQKLVRRSQEVGDDYCAIRVLKKLHYALVNEMNNPDRGKAFRHESYLLACDTLVEMCRLYRLYENEPRAQMCQEEFSRSITCNHPPKSH